MTSRQRSRSVGLLAGIGMLLASSVLTAAVLPEDRADLLYHRYDGGGVVVDGPLLLVRKGFADKVSVSASYFVDTVSSASIDDRWPCAGVMLSCVTGNGMTASAAEVMTVAIGATSASNACGASTSGAGELTSCTRLSLRRLEPCMSCR